METARTSNEVRAAFEFLEREYGFLARCGDFGIEYESEKLKISVTWYRDPSVLFWVKAETYWIRPGDVRTFDLLELVRFKVAAEALVGFSRVAPGDIVAYLHECAVLTREHAADVLGGNLKVCEDILITQRLSRLGPKSISDYAARIRAEIQSLSVEERAALEKALASNGARAIWLAFQENPAVAKLKNKRLAALLQQLWQQHCA